MEILHEKDGVDTELLVYAMTLINKVSMSCLLFYHYVFIVKYWIQENITLNRTKMKFTEYAMWFIFLLLFLQTLAALPDQDSFYDMVDGLEEQGMETVSQRHLGRKGTDLDLVEQLNIYEVWHATTWDHKDNIASWHGIAAMAWHGCNGCNIILWGNSDRDSKFNQMHKFRSRYLMGVELLQEDDGGNTSQSWREDFGVWTGSNFFFFRSPSLISTV